MISPRKLLILQIAAALATGFLLRFVLDLHPIWWLAWLAPAPLLAMAIRFSILGSGSAGNSALLQTDNTRVLVDAGFSTKRLEELLAPPFSRPLPRKPCSGHFSAWQRAALFCVTRHGGRYSSFPFSLLPRTP